jgi:hypothetical protein
MEKLINFIFLGYFFNLKFFDKIKIFQIFLIYFIFRAHPKYTFFQVLKTV